MVDENDIATVQTSNAVTFTVDAFPGREFRGMVGKVRLNATMTQNVVLYTVEINIENANKLLLPYLTANVRFVLSHETNALLVPNAALRWTPSLLAQIAPDARPGNPNDPPADDPPGGQSSKKQSGQQSSHRTLWLKDGAFVRPVEVTAGTSDGANTAVAVEGDYAVAALQQKHYQIRPVLSVDSRDQCRRHRLRSMGRPAPVELWAAGKRIARSNCE